MQNLMREVRLNHENEDWSPIRVGCSQVKNISTTPHAHDSDVLRKSCCCAFGNRDEVNKLSGCDLDLPDDVTILLYVNKSDNDTKTNLTCLLQRAGLRSYPVSCEVRVR